MEFQDVVRHVDAAVARVAEADRYLLANNLSERCIAARLAMYLQVSFPDLSVDVEYNRAGVHPKRLALPDGCANDRDDEGRSLVVPDVIVHQRGPNGPNLLVLELKKTTNSDGFDCDRRRVCELRKELRYEYGALIECETRPGYLPAIRVAEWFHN